MPRAYDPSQPILHLHVPKSGGTSLREAFRRWFGADQVKPVMPWQILQAPHPRVWSGHFDRLWGKDAAGQDFVCNPPAEIPAGQYVTFVRDPFYQLRSLFDYWRKTAGGTIGFHGKADHRLSHYAESLERFVSTCPVHWFMWLPARFEPGMRDFLFVGIVERYQQCLDALAARLGKPSIQAPHELQVKHSRLTRGDEAELRRAYRRRRPAWHVLYDEVCDVWAPQWERI
jgi:hypothetical protein